MRHTFYYFVVISLLSLVGACGSSGSSSRGAETPTPPVAAAPVSVRYQGVWLASAYGYGLQFSEASGAQFSYSTTNCILGERFDELDDAAIETAFRLTDRGLSFFSDVGTASFQAPSIVYQAAQALPASCADGFTPTIGDSDYVQNRSFDLESFYQLFREYSISLEVQGVDWEEIYAAAQVEVEESMTDAEFLDLLGRMIEPLADIHTSIVTDMGEVKFENKPTHTFLYLDEFLAANDLTLPLNSVQLEQANTYIGEQFDRYEAAIFAYAEDEGDIRVAGNGNLVWFQNGDLAYLNIRSMLGFAVGGEQDIEADLLALEQALDTILSEVQDTNGLIIDLRTNGGGRDVLALAVASRFVTADTLLYSKNAGVGNSETERVNVVVSPRGAVQYLNPVVVLVSPSTVSGAETLALSLSALDQVTLVGASTQGAFSDVLNHRLANGFEINLSNERYFSVSGEWHEGEGVPVDIEVPVFLESDRLQGEDSVIARAIEALAE